MDITVEQLLAKIGQLTILVDLKDQQIAQLQAALAAVQPVNGKVASEP